MKVNPSYYLLSLMLVLMSFGSFYAQTEESLDHETEEVDYQDQYDSEETYSFVNPRTEYLKEKLEQHRFEERAWQDVVQGLDYINSREKDRDEAFDINETNRTPSGSSGGSGFSFSSESWAGFFRFLIIAAAVITLALLMANLIGGGSLFGPRSKKIKHKDNQITIEDLEDNILESDLDKFIRMATEEQNYALAIRLFYLAIIKELSLKKDIKWKRDKTNRDYLREMRQNKLFIAFRETTVVFERIWYGNIALTELDYQNIKPKFQQLIQTIQLEGKTKV